MPQRLKYGLTNLRGRQIGDLYILQRVVSTTKHKRPRWRCQCKCGKRITVSHERLIHKRNPKVHCGCKLKGAPTLYRREYHAWWDAKQRCHDPNHPSYPSYGAKGVRMCEPWRESFEQFLADVGKRPSNNHSIDRKDPTGNYEPNNVRWATTKEQGRNKRDTKFVRHPTTGRRIAAAALAEELGISYNALRNRYIALGEWW